MFQAAASIGVGTVQTTAVNNRVDETNRRVGTNENDIKKSKAEIKTLTDTSCTKTTCDAIKDTADKACTKDKCTEICMKVMSDRSLFGSKALVLKNQTVPPNYIVILLLQVNEIFGKTAVGTADTDLGNVKNFKLTNILLTDTATADNTKTVTINGKELKAGDDGKKLAKVNADVADDRVGITAKDFDLFREKVVAANTKLQQKIDQVLNDIVAINPCA